MQAVNGRYRLGAHVRCDLLELTNLARRAREVEDDAEKIELLTEALSYVREKPFDGVLDYEWAWSENFISIAEAEVTEVACALAELHLTTGDASAALRACLTGMLAAPLSEPLFRLRIQAHVQQGDRAAARRVVGEMLSALEIDEPHLALHESTLEVMALVRDHGES